MKKADYLIIQCTETGEGQEVFKADIIEQHTNSAVMGGYGWNRPGLDYLVTLDGSLETIIPETSPNVVDLWGIGEGKNGMTGIPKFISYVGGKTTKGTKDKDTRTSEQEDTLASVVKFYVKKFPKIQVLGFNQVPSKSDESSPAFDVAKWCEEIGIPEQNIFKG
ncbi:MAG: hypothetical protein JKY51_01790 [Opitutaceae bacterium]|nr:hypothetical protein [Opitutaceae bacterium]